MLLTLPARHTAELESYTRVTVELTNKLTFVPVPVSMRFAAVELESLLFRKAVALPALIRVKI
jgi:hypothetical protein